MLPKVYLKDVLVEIRNTLGRFISIMAIVALGCAFFAGIKASAPDMKHSADTYFDKYHLQDIQVFSTLGISDKTIEQLRAVDGVEDVQGYSSMDVLSYAGNSQLVVKLFSLPSSQRINTVRLVEGRLPRAEDEALIEADSVNNSLFPSFNIGDTITLESGTDEPLSDSLKHTKYKIVGKGYSPYYLSYEKGTSAIGSGEVSTFLYIPEDDFKTGYYTEADITVKGASELNSYTDAYFDLVDPVTKKLEDMGDSQLVKRRQEMHQEVTDGQKELDEKAKEGEEQLAEAQKEIDDGRKELAKNEEKLQESAQTLADSRQTLQESQNTLNATKQDLQSKISELNAQEAAVPGLKARLPEIDNEIDALRANRADLVKDASDLEAQIDQKLSYQRQLTRVNIQLELPLLSQSRKEELEAKKADLEQAISEFPSDLESQLASVRDQQDLMDSKVRDLQSEAKDIQKQIDAADNVDKKRSQYQKQLDSLASQQKQIDDGRKKLADGQKEYDDGAKQIAEARQKLVDGEAEIEKNRQKLNDEIAKARQKIRDGAKDIDKLEGKWFVLDRNSHYSYRDYGACADRMDGIASVFPVFFYLVAALVCMTTMTRMVEEQRSEIGTLKALGYSKWQIAFKYLAYAFLASAIGAIIGSFIGMIVFPYVIFWGWNTMYNLEAVYFQFPPDLILLASASVIAIILAATLWSIYGELNEVPSQLMRPKAAKAGKKILLEHIPWLWNRFSFLQKVTLRNLFRYKKRFFMTIIGISGCSALLVAGFGLSDSISDIVHLQYETIYHYDAQVSVSENDNPDLGKQIAALAGVKDSLSEDTLNITLDVEDKDIAGTVHVIENPARFASFTTLREPRGQELPPLPEGGVYVPEKLAQKLNLSKGSKLSFTDANDQKITTTVEGVYENYVGYHIYVRPETFKSWKVDPDLITRSYLLMDTDTSPEFESQLGQKLMALDGVTSLSFYSSLQDNFLNMISSIRLVVLVLIAAAAALAFVVLYNLSNVNISERFREIATIKVLGFTEKEVNQYVNRETLLLAAIGGLAGLGLGIYLHRIIMALAELDDIMFGRTITPLSFFLSFAFTMVFSLAVNWIMKFKIRKIEMVESLKAIE